MAAAHERFGSLPWADLVQPAIDLAQNGFEIDPWTAGSFGKYGEKFAALDERFREQVEFKLYFEGESGDRLKIPDLAGTLRRIAEQGPDEFYTGRTAELIVEEMRARGRVDHGRGSRGLSARVARARRERLSRVSGSCRCRLRRRAD